MFRLCSWEWPILLSHRQTNVFLQVLHFFFLLALSSNYLPFFFHLPFAAFSFFFWCLPSYFIHSFFLFLFLLSFSFFLSFFLLSSSSSSSFLLPSFIFPSPSIFLPSSFLPTFVLYFPIPFPFQCFPSFLCPLFFPFIPLPIYLYSFLPTFFLSFSLPFFSVFQLLSFFPVSLLFFLCFVCVIH